MRTTMVAIAARAVNTGSVVTQPVTVCWFGIAPPPKSGVSVTAALVVAAGATSVPTAVNGVKTMPVTSAMLGATTTPLAASGVSVTGVAVDTAGATTTPLAASGVSVAPLLTVATGAINVPTPAIGAGVIALPTVTTGAISVPPPDNTPSTIVVPVPPRSVDEKSSMNPWILIPTFVPVVRALSDTLTSSTPLTYPLMSVPSQLNSSGSAEVAAPLPVASRANEPATCLNNSGAALVVLQR